jgi:hypothetical protein
MIQVLALPLEMIRGFLISAAHVQRGTLRFRAVVRLAIFLDHFEYIITVTIAFFYLPIQV